MDYLAALVVQAVETVDQRRGRKRTNHSVTAGPSERSAESLNAVRRAYAQGAGTWTGCDWATHFGKAGLDLNGWTAAEAEAVSRETIDGSRKEDWCSAVRWLSEVEARAQEAEKTAVAAVKAASAGLWEDALRHAERAWALEFSTGRPFRRGFPLAWQALREAIETAYLEEPSQPG
jgi:hypothetical protein